MNTARHGILTETIVLLHRKEFPAKPENLAVSEDEVHEALVHPWCLPGVGDPVLYSEHDLVLSVRPVRFVLVLLNVLRFQQLQSASVLLSFNSTLNDDSVHTVFNVEDDSRI